MTCGRPIGFVVGRAALRERRGFSLVEVLVVAAIVVLTSVIAVPLVMNLTASMTMQGAVSAVKSGIQSTRYQAIYQGCPYQIVFTAATASYQVQGQPYSAAAGGCAAAMTNICRAGLATCPVALAGTPPSVALNADVTLLFKPGGSVTSPSFPAGGINMTLTYRGLVQNIQVSTYGNITP
jgi:prepilin-type N-terminal cleavage/methylation domain-containing protein